LPRTVETIMCFAEKRMSVWAGSTFQVLRVLRVLTVLTVLTVLVGPSRRLPVSRSVRRSRVID
jgi:hypothetical protein